MIRVAVCGACGRMGQRIIRTILQENDIEVVAGIETPKSPKIGEDIGKVAGEKAIEIEIVGSDELKEELREANPDVLVDFTIAKAAVENVKIAAEAGVAVVVGTTGFSEEQREEMSEAIQENNIPAVIAPNMSVGVNVLFKIARELGETLEDYDIELIEAHHNKKLDAPSGTALKIAEIIADATNRDLEEVAKYGRPKGELGERKKEEIGIHAIRAGNISGEHKLIFAGPSERLELTHKAQSRQAFADGVTKAIRYLVENGEPGEIHDMQDALGINEDNE
ncbi:MAG: 4-hydroxy-tetrahydrodipicolinate reductase [Hadesarchaea archaeon]|nr:4-hydroxy-tetrahydrodipicolinate reductase [Hadesarchaea archaeon]